jgi:gelsolin
MSIGIDIINDDIKNLITYDFSKTEPEFDSISPNQPLLMVWRIEKLKLKKWPKENFGTFYDGDSFLILNIKSIDEKNAHVWTGKNSSKDEISYVSYKVLQLDQKLENNLEIFYESQGNESKLFKSYFNFFTVVKGGVEANLELFKKKSYKARLFHVHGDGANLQSREVPINKKNLDSGDVYLLDTGLKVYIWIGIKSSGFEKFHIACLSKKISEMRDNKVTIFTIDEKGNQEIDLKIKKEFDEMMEKYEEEMTIEKKENIYDGPKKMMKLSDEKGKFELSDVPYSKDSLHSNDSFLIDRGDALIIWIGKDASKKEKRYARLYANKYISSENRTKGLPIYVTVEGKKNNELDRCFA